MCLLFVGWQVHPRYRVVLAANRDEFHARPTEPAGFWDDQPALFAGRDRQAGGAWLGVTRTGRFAAVTNYREPDPPEAGRHSRGELVCEALLTPQPLETCLRRLGERADEYGGYNLLAGDSGRLYYLSNRNGPLQRLETGVYGLSNGLLDSCWPKVEAGKKDFRRTLEQSDSLDPETLLALLADDTPAVPSELPDTGVGTEHERMLSPRFIRNPHYGTRSSTVVLVDREGEVRFVERRFDAAGRTVGETDETFRYTAPDDASAPV